MWEEMLHECCMGIVAAQHLRKPLTPVQRAYFAAFAACEKVSEYDCQHASRKSMHAALIYACCESAQASVVRVRTLAASNASLDIMGPLRFLLVRAKPACDLGAARCHSWLIQSHLYPYKMPQHLQVAAHLGVVGVDMLVLN